MKRAICLAIFFIGNSTAFGGAGEWLPRSGRYQVDSLFKSASNCAEDRVVAIDLKKSKFWPDYETGCRILKTDHAGDEARLHIRCEDEAGNKEPPYVIRLKPLDDSGAVIWTENGSESIMRYCGP